MSQGNAWSAALPQVKNENGMQGMRKCIWYLLEKVLPDRMECARSLELIVSSVSETSPEAGFVESRMSRCATRSLACRPGEKSECPSLWGGI
jgi:hypothetical protein